MPCLHIDCCGFCFRKWIIRPCFVAQRSDAMPSRAFQKSSTKNDPAMVRKDAIGIAQGMEQLSVCYFNPESLVECIVWGNGFHGNQAGPNPEQMVLDSRR